MKFSFLSLPKAKSKWKSRQHRVKEVLSGSKWTINAKTLFHTLQTSLKLSQNTSGIFFTTSSLPRLETSQTASQYRRMQTRHYAEHVLEWSSSSALHCTCLLARSSHVERQAKNERVEVREVNYNNSRGLNTVSAFASAELLGSCQRYNCRKRKDVKFSSPLHCEDVKHIHGWSWLTYYTGWRHITEFSRNQKEFYLKYFLFCWYGCCEQLAALPQGLDALAVTKKEQVDLLSLKISVASCLCARNKE